MTDRLLRVRTAACGLLLVLGWLALASEAPLGAAETHELRLLGQVGAPATAVVVDGDLAYAALADRLVVLDVSDPADVRRVGGPVPLPGRARTLAASDGTIVAVMGEAGLAILDAADATAPRLAGVLDTPGSALDVALEGDTAYVADRSSGLLVVDVSDPADPSVVAASGSVREARSVAAVGTTVYVGERDAFEQGVRIVDASDPAAPVERSFLDVLDFADDLAAANGVVYALVSRTGAPFVPYLRVLDVSDPARPRIVVPEGASGPPGARPAQVGPSPGTDDWQRSGALGLSDGWLFVAYGSQLYAYDVARDPKNPASTGASAAPWGVAGVAGHGPVAVVAAGPAGVVLLDASTPGGKELGTYAENAVGRPVGLHAVGNRLYVADGLGSLRVIDASDPTEPRVVTHWPAVSSPADVAVGGAYVYLAEALVSVREGTTARYRGGIEILSLADPEAPVLASTVFETCAVPAVALDGARAYALVPQCVGGTSGAVRGLAVVDVSDPLWPDVIGVATLTLWQPTDVAVRGPIAYLTDAGRGVTAAPSSLWTIDISGDEPAPLARLDLPSPARAVAVAGRHAYLAAATAGLVMADVGDPASPIVVQQIGLPGEARAVAVADGRAYVAGAWGVSVFDVSVPARPVKIAETRTPGAVAALAVADGRVHVGLDDGLVLVFALAAIATATPTQTRTAAASATPTPTPVPVTPSATPGHGARLALPIAFGGRS